MAKELDATGSAKAELEEMRAELARKIAAHVPMEGPVDTAVPGLILSRRTAPSECFCTTYEPELVVFAQGEKRITVGGTTHLCDGSTFLLTSVDLPVESQIIKASKSEPYLALVLKLEMPVVREILSQEEFLRRRFPSESAAWRWARPRSSCWGLAPDCSICWTRPRIFPFSAA